MTTRNIVLIAIVCAALIGSIAYVSTSTTPSASSMRGATPEDAAMQKADVPQESSGAMMPKDDAMKDGEGAMMPSSKGSIETYSPEKLSLAQDHKVVLFFHASWCPICRQLDAEAKADPEIVPDGVRVLKVDYDTATSLRQKYGVTVQHTFVQVDASGASLGKWSDATKYADVFSRLQ